MARVKSNQTSPWSLEKVLPWLLLVGGAIALVSAFFLSADYIKFLKNPAYQPVCNLNPIFSCTSVMGSEQAHAFGIPNEFIGLAGYAMVMASGIALLAGSKPFRWAWRWLNLGLLFAVGFITWLQFQTLYRIGALCIFCMIVWATTIPMFWYTSLYNFGAGNLPTSKRFAAVIAFARRHHGDILLVWFLIIVALILKRFWYYWSTLI